jgi:hypothetical protein
MSSLDGQNLFGSGPHSFRPGAWERSLERRGFPGLDGELVMNLGLRSRVIAQTGRLQAASAASVVTLISQIEARNDGKTHVLVDAHGRTFSRVILEQFELTTPIQRGRNYWCEYSVRYRQLP